MEVTNNPTSRRIVLDEIFRGSSKLVEFPSNKRRVQVKKHRKKTPEELCLGCCSKDEEQYDIEMPRTKVSDEFDDDLGSVRGRMIICISDKNVKEKDTSGGGDGDGGDDGDDGDDDDDDDDTSSGHVGMDSCERENVIVIGNTVLVKDNDNHKNLILVKDGKPPVTLLDGGRDGCDSSHSSNGNVSRFSPNCLRDSLDAEKSSSSLIKLSIPDVDVNTSKTSFLHPKLSPNPHDESDDEKNGELALTSTLCQQVERNNISSGLVIPSYGSDDTDDDGDESLEEVEELIHKSSIFRKETEGGAEIESSSSMLTEVTSNVVDNGVNGTHLSSGRLQMRSSDFSSRSDSDLLENPIPLKNVVSGKSSKTDTSSNKEDTSSNISYYSYEEMSIASEESEICAICLTPYYEGDIRIFSKRCPHAFHKDCLFEWLVKGHDECPCCRIEMVTKSEVKETSASLIGTERLAQALASTMVEAPPIRFRQARMTQMFARARQHRRRSVRAEVNENDSSSRQNAINSHWLWNSRFELPSSSSSSARANLSPVNEVFPQSVSNVPPAPLQTRSFDAIMDPQPTETLVLTRSFDAITDTQTSQVESASRTAANVRNFHSHWASWNNAQLTRTQRRSSSTQTPFSTTSSPLSRLRRSGSNPPSPLPLTVLPAIRF